MWVKFAGLLIRYEWIKGAQKFMHVSWIGVKFHVFERCFQDTPPQKKKKQEQCFYHILNNWRNLHHWCLEPSVIYMDCKTQRTPRFVFFPFRCFIYPPSYISSNSFSPSSSFASNLFLFTVAWDLAYIFMAWHDRYRYHLPT